MKIRVCKTFEFAASHKLPEHKGKCQNLHGHTYKLEIVVETLAAYVRDQKSGDDPYGMVIEFADVKSIVEQNIISRLDHTHLNDTISNPTAEVIALRIFDALKHPLSKFDVDLYKVRLWESPTSYAEVVADEYD